MSRHFGLIEGIAIGQSFKDRVEMSVAGIHAPRVAGISGSQKEGADSIVVSGGYIDDQDFGNVIIYTGHGGNNPDNKRQTKDQQLTRGNKALAISCDNGYPVRVTRGADRKNPNAPTSGYRFDGLFAVTRYWQAKGKDGFKIWRFRLEKIDAPRDEKNATLPEGEINPDRVTTSVQRIVRSTVIANSIKKLYDDRCQICGIQIATLSGYYSEGCHIRPLGAGHNGPDTPDNVLCLCPNCHVRFDSYAFSIHLDLTVIDNVTGSKLAVLNVDPSHRISKEHLQYRFDLWRPELPGD